MILGREPEVLVCGDYKCEEEERGYVPATCQPSLHATYGSDCVPEYDCQRLRDGIPDAMRKVE